MTDTSTERGERRGEWRRYDGKGSRLTNTVKTRRKSRLRKMEKHCVEEKIINVMVNKGECFNGKG